MYASITVYVSSRIRPLGNFIYCKRKCSLNLKDRDYLVLVSLGAWDYFVRTKDIMSEEWRIPLIRNCRLVRMLFSTSIHLLIAIFKW